MTCRLMLGLLAIQATAVLSSPTGPVPDFPGRFGDAFAFSAWIQTSRDGSIFAWTVPEGAWMKGGRCLFIENGRLAFDIGWVGRFDGETAVADGQWHHVVLCGGYPQRLYVDGYLDGQGRLDARPGPEGAVLKLGDGASDFPEDGSIRFHGLLDEVVLYNRALSADEVGALAEASGPPMILPGVVARWSFDGHTRDVLGGDASSVRVEPREPFSRGIFGQALRLTSESRVATALSTDAPPVVYRGRKALSEYAAALPSRRLLFVKRDTFHSSHFYTDFIDGCSRYGGNLCLLDLDVGTVTDLVPEMADGIFGRYDLHFSADRIVFDWKASPREGFRLYEIDVDPARGTRTGGPRQLTYPPEDEAARIRKYDNSHLGGTARMYYHQTDDMHPCYLPDGGILFVSTRCEHGTLCDAPDVLSTTVLHRMDEDGRNIRQLSRSPVSEFSPSVLEDGRVLYTRWEYVDKGQLGVKCLWAVRPDGSGSVEVYGNDIQFPPTFLHGRQIPGRANQIVFLGTPHHPQSGIGTVILADTSRNIRSREPMTYITPHVDVRQEPGWNQLRNGRWTRHENGPLYMDPFPLSEQLFLVAHNPDRPWDDPTAYGLYLLSARGDHVRIHDEASTSCWQPMPFRARPVPPVLPTTVDAGLARRDLAVCVVQDVHRGMGGVEPGEVKYLRIMEQVPRPWDARRFWDPDNELLGHTDLVGGGALAVKAMWGIVPVEEDGSAHFYVPAMRNIYFQALDGDYLELQRERTFVNYMPGETRSCVGCHESTGHTPALNAPPPIAMRKPPVLPGPQPGDTTGRQVLHFPSYVQPVLDRYCVACHGDDIREADLDLRGTPTDLFSVSWENLVERGSAPTYAEASDWDGIAYAPPKSIGSYRSPLIRTLRKTAVHRDLGLPPEAFVRLSTWVDASGVFYGSYWGRRHLDHRDHPFFRPTPTFEEALSTTCPVPLTER